MRQGATELSTLSFLPALTPASASGTFPATATPVVAEIFKHIEIVFKVLQKAGIPSRPYTPNAVQKLYSLSEDRHQQLLTGLRFWTEALGASNTPDLIGEVDFPTEVRLVEKALRQLQFHLKNHSWTRTEEEQIIEVYNLEGIQLYRSLSFFKTCGYSLLDLCINEWYILWERPQKILQEMNIALQGRLSGHTQGSDPGISPHLVMENFDDGTTQPFLPRAVFVNFTGWYPLHSEQGNVCGFILTSTAKVVSEGTESLKIDFI